MFFSDDGISFNAKRISRARGFYAGNSVFYCAKLCDFPCLVRQITYSISTAKLILSLKILEASASEAEKACKASRNGVKHGCGWAMPLNLAGENPASVLLATTRVSRLAGNLVTSCLMRRYENRRGARVIFNNLLRLLSFPSLFRNKFGYIVLGIQDLAWILNLGRSCFPSPKESWSFQCSVTKLELGN